MPKYSAVVADASPLISLEKLPDGFALLAHTCSRLLVPQAVVEEVSYFLTEGEDYFRRHRVRDAVAVEVVPTAEIALVDEVDPEELDRGERYAIALARTRRTPILIEERKGRRVARSYGLVVFGAAAVVKIAFEQGGIDHGRAVELLQALYRANRINLKVLERMLRVMVP